MQYKDLYLNEDGDLEVGFNGDLKVVYDDDVMVESIIFRLKTFAGDYELAPQCGASLEDFIGAPNTKELGKQIESRVMSALTHDGFLSLDQFTVRVSPLTPTSLLILVTVDGLRGNFSVLSSLDLLTGELTIQ
jgi:phage baseplate assembly protein W